MGELGAARDIVVANSAAAMWVVDPASSLPAAAKRAKEAIDSGEPKNCSANWSITPTAFEHESNHAWLKSLDSSSRSGLRHDDRPGQSGREI